MSRVRKAFMLRLPPELIAKLDQEVESKANWFIRSRTQLIEKACWKYLAELEEERSLDPKKSGTRNAGKSGTSPAPAAKR